MQLMQPVTGGENTAFDLGTLTNSDRVVVVDCANEVWNFMRRTARDAVVVGRKLQAVKKILGHGRFGAWLRTGCPLAEDTAGRFMKIAERFGHIPHNAEFALTALYTLAADDTPDSAREEAVKLAAKGEKITPALAKAIKARHATGAVPVPPPEETPSNGSRPGDTPPAHEVVTDSVEDRDPASSSSAPVEAEPTGRAMKSRNEARGGGEQNRPEPGPASPIRRKSVSPDELVEAIDRILAVMPSDGRAGWEKFVDKARRLPTERRRMLIGKLTILAEKAVNVRRKL